MLILLTILACKDQATLDENDKLKQRLGDLERANGRLEKDNLALKVSLAAADAARAAVTTEARVTALGVKPGQSLVAVFKTSEGDIRCTLRPTEAPETVLNFVQLARGQKEWTHPRTAVRSTTPLYDGTKFHRVIPGFMIQGGDPQGNGMGGPGYQFADEVGNFTVFDHPGILAMANSGPDTNGSQFFITEGTPTHLNGKHTIFGDCENLDIVTKIAHTEGVVLEHVVITP